MDSSEDSTLDLLTWAYGRLHDAWLRLSLSEECDESAPWNQWQFATVDGDAVHGRDMLLTAAHLAAGDAAKSVGHHLRLLAMAYPSNAMTDDGLDLRGWPGFASFTVARAVLEGVASLDWLLQEDADERACRTARLELWSASEQRKSGFAPEPGRPGSVEAIRAIVEGAGFVVREYGRNGQVGVLVDGRPQSFQPTQAIAGLLGNRGRSLYRGWSGTAHHAPWALRPWTVVRTDDEPGLLFSTYVFEDKHVELAADVSEVLRAGARSLGDYFGRDTARYIEVCTDVESHLRAAILTIRHALGRPGSDNDPTQRQHRRD